MEPLKPTDLELCQTLYETYSPELFGFCASRVREREEAMDIVQDAFVKLWTVIRSGEEIHNPRALLYTIVRNKIIDQYRSVALQRVFPLSDELLDILSIDSSSIIEQSELRIILQTINTLPDTQRETLLYRYIDGMPVQDIADIFDVSPNTISQRIKRGILAVQKILSLEPNPES